MFRFTDDYSYFANVQSQHRIKRIWMTDFVQLVWWNMLIMPEEVL